MVKKLFSPSFSSGNRYPVTVFLSIILFTGHIDAQVLKDTVALRLVKESVDQMYDMRFDKAGETTEKIGNMYPEHPVVYLLKGMIIYWEHFPLIAGTDPGRSFEEHMWQCIELDGNYESENEAEYLLTSLCARGSLLAYFVGNELPSRVFSLGRTSYRYLRRSFGFTGTFPDFYFFTGLYNYYREAYPDAHPGYKPLFALFPRGSREKGMSELKIAFRESIFLKAEASTFLSSNYKYFENDYKNAAYFSRTIYYEFPRNMVYRINCIEDMLLTGRNDEAEKLLVSSKTKNEYYSAQLNILRGILYEKKYNDMDMAEQFYAEGAEKILEFGNFGKQYAAYAYFGLSRISSERNDRHAQRVYRRKAMDLTDFENVSFDEVTPAETDEQAGF